MTAGGETEPTWLQVDWRVEREALEAAEDTLVSLGIPGWQTLEDPHGIRLRLWILPEDRPRLEAAVGDREALAIRTEPAPGWSQDWGPQWAGPFVVVRLGAPAPSVRPDQHRIWLAPALAFGGGEHPSTRSSLEHLPSLVRTGARVLDVGCGSGVLSVAAQKLGAGQVDAVDVDPTALRATARAAEANRTPIRVLGPSLDLAEGPYDLVLANILAPVLLELAPDLKALLGPKGRLLLSGIAKGREPEVVAAYRPLTLLSQVEDTGWMTLSLNKP